MYSDLELLIRRGDEDTFLADLRYSPPDGETDERPLSGADGVIRIPLPDLAELDGQWSAYGVKLGESVFSGKVKETFQELRKATDRVAGCEGMRLRLLIDSSARELDSLHWEAIADPDGSGKPLCINERIAFSRFLTSTDPRPVRGRPRGKLAALIVISSPSDIERYRDEHAQNLTPIETDQVLAEAEAAIGPEVTIERLTTNGQVTLTNILAALRKGIDILYLVSHGSFTSAGEPRLYLESEDPAKTGQTKAVLAEDLVRGIQNLSERPRLVVLGSCQSAGSKDGRLDRFRAAIGPRLAEVGVPAVIAMRGNVAAETSNQFMRAFFQALNSAESPCAGQIDHAMTVARNSVRERKDFWVPILFLRLKSGRIWYTPGFGGGSGPATLKTWTSITNFVKKGKVIPIIGPDLAEQFFGSVRDNAAAIAAKYGYPMPAWERGDLAKVSQYLAVNDSVTAFRDELGDLVLARARQKIGGPEGASLDLERLIASSLDRPDNPYNILASKLKASVYVSANGDAMLASALRKHGREATELVCNWRDERRAEYESEKLTPDKPGLYYVFGRDDGVDSLVTTEDDFFDFLIQMSAHKLMPLNVSGVLPLNSLMFLGFPLEDWKFRVLFRLIYNIGGRALWRNTNHVGVQVNPDEASIADAKRAARYLESYFKGSKIDIYWGQAADFLRELSAAMDKAG